MSKALHVLSEFYRTPWGLLPETLAAAQMVILRWASGARLDEDEIAAAVGERPAVMAARRDQEVRAGGDMIAVLPVFGVIGHRARLVQDISSGVGTSTELLGRQFRAAMQDPAVGAIVLDVDSPGGSAFGVDELAAEIHAARGRKPVVASVNSMAASAAYWIAAAAEEVVVTPGGVAGSIGVWTAHQDLSKALEMDGVKVTLVSAGKYKVEGNPYGPLDDTARAAMQDTVDKYYGMFARAVAKYRGDSTENVRKGYGEGRVLTAQDAVREKLADRVGTFDEVVAGLQRRLAAARRGKSAALAARQLAQAALR